MPTKEKVTKVINGDTFETSRRKHPVRLANVVTPQKGQTGYMAAKKDLTKQIMGRIVTIDTVKRDSCHRSVAMVKLGAKSVNKAMEKYER